MLPVYLVKPSVSLNREILQGERILAYEEFTLRDSALKALIVLCKNGV